VVFDLAAEAHNAMDVFRHPFAYAAGVELEPAFAAAA
jgi:hypothetical protein